MNIRNICNPLNIIFREKDHKYFSDENENHVSVTTVLKGYFIPFPKSAAKAYAKKHDRTLEDVQKEWDWKRDLGTEIGSWLHIQVENQLQNKIPDLDYLLTKSETSERQEKKDGYIKNYHIQIAKYLKYAKQFTYLGSEVIVGNKKNAGQIDNLFSECIHDLKNDKEINFESWFYINWQGVKISKKMLPPFEDLDDCNWNKYCLQVNLYHYLLPEEIQNCFTEPHKIIKFDRYSEDFEVHEIPDWQDRIKQIME
jgi:hypothetical protein